MKLGTQNLELVVMLAVEMGNVGDKMGRTKGMERYFHLTALFDELVALGNIDSKQVVEEFKDLDAAERKAIEDKVKAKFDIADDQLEGMIEEALGIVGDASSIVTRSVALFKGFKKDEA